MSRSGLEPTTLLELREQFSTPEQQRETSSIGMWIFVISEFMLFAALFMAYTVYHVMHPHVFDVASSHMTTMLGGINTAIIITSSFTMALAVHSSEVGNQKLLMLFLLITMLLGLTFLGIKFTEYYVHWLDREVPGVWFEFKGAFPGQVQMFFIFYFILTGLHVIHMTAGLGILACVFFRTFIGSITAEYNTPVNLAGVYWSFVDMIWIFLYAIFYIPGLHLK